MSLKQLRKQATSGPRGQCPACGKNVSVLELTSGRHAASDCEPFKHAIYDASIPKFQRELQKEHDQSTLVMKRQTWSARHFDSLGESNFIRNYWAASMLALALFSWLVGYQTPWISDPPWASVFVPPLIVGTMIVLAIKGGFWFRPLLHLFHRSKK